MKTLILASSSPRRQELIRMLQLPYQIVSNDVDETISEDLTPVQIVEELSLRKARASAEKITDKQSIVIGSDTIVVVDGQVLGKPGNEHDSFRMLNMIQGRTHQVYTGITCIDTGGSKAIAKFRATDVNMKPLSDDQIWIGTATGEPKDRAGDYGSIMHLGDIGQYRILSKSASGLPEIIAGHIVSKVTFKPMTDAEIEAYVKTGEPLDKAGSYGVQGLGSVFIEKIEGDFYSVMGLPLNLLYQILLKFEVSPFKA